MHVQNLAAPEYCSAGGVESLRRLTWRCIYRHTCYYVTLTVLQRFARSQISVNGFVVDTRKHSMLTQARLNPKPLKNEPTSRDLRSCNPAIKRSHLFQPAWLTRCLAHRLDHASRILVTPAPSTFPMPAGSDDARVSRAGVFRV